MVNQRILFELMELYRLWKVPRYQMTRVLELSRQMHEADFFPTFASVQSFEHSFKNSGHCITPEFMMVDSQAVAHIRQYKIGYIK